MVTAGELFMQGYDIAEYLKTHSHDGLCWPRSKCECYNGNLAPCKDWGGGKGGKAKSPCVPGRFFMDRNGDVLLYPSDALDRNG